MGVAHAVWCVDCGRSPEAVITVERRGVMMHYGTCWQHLSAVAARAQSDAGHLDAQDRQAMITAQRKQMAASLDNDVANRRLAISDG